MTGSTKQKTIVLLGLVVLITILIAANLPRVEFQPGMPLPRLETGQLVAAPVEAAPYVSVSTPTFILVLIGLVLSGAALYTAYQLLQGVDWRLILVVLRYLLIVSLVIGCLIFMIMLFPGPRVAVPAQIPIPTSTPEPVVTSPLGSAPPSLLWLVGLGLLVSTVLAVVWMFKPSRQAPALQLVGWEAEKALQALITGTDLKDVIVHCYRQMSLAMKQEQGIEREDFMTTGEFETILESAGIPHEPIHQLTRLFESVRYGGQQPGAAEEQKALRCLEAIIVYSRESGEKN